jgi:uncharacterized protein (TIGR02145 family)
MKRKMILLEALLVTTVIATFGQVRIGIDAAPHPGAILDLSTTGETGGSGLGLLLPQVALDNVSAWFLAGDHTDGAGMMIYNINEDVIGGNGRGIYVWNGSEWSPITKPALAVDVKLTGFDVLPASADVYFWVDESQSFSVSNFIPADASYQGVKWTISSGHSCVKITSSLMTSCTVKGLASGDAVLSIQGLDDNFTKTVNLHIKPTAGIAEIGNNTYNIYCYPNNLGCWMTDNSKEGNANKKRYGYAINETTLEAINGGYNPNASSGERGYYYAWSNASSACPGTDGWHLPNATEFTNLMNYLNSASATAAEKAGWFDASELAGDWSMHYSHWDAWNNRGRWWINATNLYFVAEASKMEGSMVYNNRYFTVRCVKSN